MAPPSKQPQWSLPEFDAWINSTPTSMPSRHDRDTRTKIRKQAMKHIAAERKSWRIKDVTLSLRRLESKCTVEGCASKHETITALITYPKQQHPPDSRSTSNCKSPSQITNSYVEEAAIMASLQIPECISLKAPPSFNVRYNFNPQGFSCKAEIAIGRALSHPREIALLIVGHNHQSYFSYIQSRYGDSTCLTEATDCIVDRVRCLLAPTDAELERAAIYSYTKVLQSMHKGLQDCHQSDIQDLLVATEILALYEVWSQVIKAWIPLSCYITLTPCQSS
jgi:hypothetical protein